MKLPMDISQAFVGDVSINLSSDDVFMAEEFLNSKTRLN